MSILFKRVYFTPSCDEYVKANKNPYNDLFNNAFEGSTMYYSYKSLCGSINADINEQKVSNIEGKTKDHHNDIYETRKDYCENCNANTAEKLLVSSSTQTSICFDKDIKEMPMNFTYDRNAFLLDILVNSPLITENKDTNGYIKRENIDHFKYNLNYLNSAMIMYGNKHKVLTRSCTSLIVASSCQYPRPIITKRLNNSKSQCNASWMIVRQNGNQTPNFKRITSRNYKFHTKHYENKIHKINGHELNQSKCTTRYLSKKQKFFKNLPTNKLSLPDECDMVLNEEKYHRCPRGILQYQHSDQSKAIVSIVTNELREPVVWFMRTGVWIANLLNIFTRLLFGST